MIFNEKATQLLKHWQLENEPLSGNEHVCYVGEHYILKSTADLQKLSNHIEVSKAIESVGLLAATVVETAQGQKYIREGELYYYLTKRLPGMPMDACGMDAEKACFTGRIIGRLHGALRKAEADLPEADLLATVRDWALPKAKDALGLSDRFSKEYLDTFAALYPRLPRQAIHRDPHPGNIICAEDQWGFIDFELSERNVRIYDPCYAATAVLSQRFGKDESKWPDIYRNIMQGYDSVAQLTQEEHRAIPYVLLANQLVCVAWFAEQAAYPELFETNKQMTLWLLQRFEELINI